MPAGRPTLYSEEMLQRTHEYLNSCVDEEVQELTGLSAKGTELYKNRLIVHLPSIEGLALYLDVARSTLYLWAETNPEFSDIIEKLRATQAKVLLEKGLSGHYNQTITKVLLTKHGYREGSEISGKDGEPITVQTVTGMRIMKDGDRIQDKEPETTVSG